MGTDLAALEAGSKKVGPGAHECGNKDESENRKAGKKSLKQQLDLLISSPL